MTKPTFDEEKILWQKGYNYVVGIDEVGRGCFAGPVVVGAVVFPKNYSTLSTINDSKLLKIQVRKETAKEILKNALNYSIAEISVTNINKFGIGKATQMGFRKAIKLLNIKPDFILIDAFYIKHMKRKNQKAIVKGDQKCASIAAASVIAKVYRDNLMKKLDKEFPNYNFAKHKGYGTLDHRKAIHEFGLSEMHRTSFALQRFL